VEHRVKLAVEVEAALELRVLGDRPVELLAVEARLEVLFVVPFVVLSVVVLPGVVLLVLVPPAVEDAAVDVENKLNFMKTMHSSKHSEELVILAMNIMIS
jgi:hypothetical protein